MPTGTGAAHYRPPSRVAVYVAARVGLRPGAVEQLIRGRDAVHLRTAALLDGALALADFPLAARILAPIRSVEAGHGLTEQPRDLLALDCQVDAGEDCARLAYLANPTPENRNALARRCRERAGVLLRLLAALEREQLEARS